MSQKRTIQDWQSWLSDQAVVLDGGMATSLEAAGHDLSGKLWSARILVENPSAISQVHESHARAGAHILTSASYQVSEHGFLAAGLSRAAAQESIHLSVDVARAAARSVSSEDGIDRYVAASVGPWGATLADGSEYRGDYQATQNELYEFHVQRLELFLAAQPDLLAIETIPAALELAAINQALSDLKNTVPTWVSCSALNPQEICDGTPIHEARSLVQHDSVIAFGFNCSAPEHMQKLVTAASTAPDALPVIIYPNAGRTWDAKAREWLDEGADSFSVDTISQWVDAGARFIGGCCGLGEKHISSVASYLRA